jgi:hypothetical protein
LTPTDARAAACSTVAIRGKPSGELLGHPARNGPKYFAAAELEKLRRNIKWLAKASDAIVDYWQNRNAHKNSSHDSVHRAELVSAG